MIKMNKKRKNNSLLKLNFFTYPSSRDKSATFQTINLYSQKKSNWGFPQIVGVILSKTTGFFLWGGRAGSMVIRK